MKGSSMTDTRRPGRPALPPDEKKSASISVKMRDALYDQAYARAERDRIKLPELIRRALSARLDDDDDGDD